LGNINRREVGFLKICERVLAQRLLSQIWVTLGLKIEFKEPEAVREKMLLQK